MNEIYKLTGKELMDINNILINKTSISDSSPCYCGNNKKFSNCCKIKSNHWSANTNFNNKVVDFLKSKNWNHITKQEILFLLPEFQKYYLESLYMCSRPGCTNKPTINSHVYGKKHIEKYLLTSQCKIHNSYSNSINYFDKTNTGKPITYRIFCKKCEQLFKDIDNQDHDIINEYNCFLHFLRTQSYQYQITRFDLAFAHQFILSTKAIIEIERQKTIGKTDITIDCDWFLKNNIRYQHQTILRDKFWNILENNIEKNKIPYIYTRCFPVKKVLFASGIYNPSHDLNGVKIIFKENASFFYFVIPKNTRSICMAIASFDKEYQEMIKQVANLNDYDFKKYINHLISFCSLPLNLILQDSYNVTNQMIDKIKKKEALTLKDPNDLDSREIFARFII